MSAPIPILLITGYLGAGKTTLLNRLIAQCQDTRVRLAIVVNDFGSVGVDAQLVRRGNFAIAEIPGGCICCSGPAEVTDAVSLVVNIYQPDWIVIETSGLADPVDTVNVLLMPETVHRWRLGRIVALIDADLFLRDETSRALAERQVPFADLVIVNKTDLVTDAKRKRVLDYLRKLNANVAIRETVQADVSLNELLGPVAAGADRGPLPHARGAHIHTSFRSMTYNFAEPVREQTFRDVLATLAPGVIRSKGFIRLAGKGGIHRFQTVDKHVDIMLWPEKETPPLVGVFIGQGLDEERLRAALQAAQ